MGLGDLFIKCDLGWMMMMRAKGYEQIADERVVLLM